MNLRTIIIFFFTISSSVSIAQASWSYSIKFKLISKENDTISIENFKNGKIKLLSASFGAHLNSKLEFDSKSNSFIFSQHTITTSSVLVFQTLTDITTLNIQTTNLDLGTVELTGRDYSFKVWDNEERFARKKNEIEGEYWELKYPFKSYIKENKDATVNKLDILDEVEIK